jgi:(2S)-methylsuccinyl-CoA dehydrogenase
VRTSAEHLPGGGWSITGVKNWCTFGGRADVLMLLARTNPDPSAGHRGLSVFIVEKPRELGHAFRFSQDGGVMEGGAIDTLGYRVLVLSRRQWSRRSRAGWRSG